MKIFLICPVRNITEKQKENIKNLVEYEESIGNNVYWPLRDTDQIDNVGLRICKDNLKAIKNCDKVLIWWDSSSQGSLFDFGMAFALKKPIELINSVDATEYKSFSNVLLKLSER